MAFISFGFYRAMVPVIIVSVVRPKGGIFKLQKSMLDVILIKVA